MCERGSTVRVVTNDFGAVIVPGVELTSVDENRTLWLTQADNSVMGVFAGGSWAYLEHVEEES